jgi:hypothetical protein
MRQGYDAPTKAWVLKANIDISSKSRNPSPTPLSPDAVDDARALVEAHEEEGAGDGAGGDTEGGKARGGPGKAAAAKVGRASDERRLRGTWTVSSVLFSKKPSLPSLLQATSPSHLRQLAQEGWQLSSSTTSSASLLRSTCELLCEGERSVDQCIHDFATAFSLWYDAHVDNEQLLAEQQHRLARLERLRTQSVSQMAARDRHELSLGGLAKAAIAAQVCYITRGTICDVLDM